MFGLLFDLCLEGVNGLICWGVVLVILVVDVLDVFFGCLELVLFFDWNLLEFDWILVFGFEELDDILCKKVLIVFGFVLVDLDELICFIVVLLCVVYVILLEFELVGCFECYCGNKILLLF